MQGLMRAETNVLCYYNRLLSCMKLQCQGGRKTSQSVVPGAQGQRGWGGGGDEHMGRKLLEQESG